MSKTEDVFTCPECGAHKLEEILVNVEQTSVITDIELDSDAVDYGAVTHDGGNVDRYQCVECGWIVPGIDGPEGLTEYLKERI